MNCKSKREIKIRQRVYLKWYSEDEPTFSQPMSGEIIHLLVCGSDVIAPAV